MNLVEKIDTHRDLVRAIEVAKEEWDIIGDRVLAVLSVSYDEQTGYEEDDFKEYMRMFEEFYEYVEYDLVPAVENLISDDYEDWRLLSEVLNDLETELENYDRQVAGQRYKNLWNEQGEDRAEMYSSNVHNELLYLSNLVKRAV